MLSMLLVGFGRVKADFVILDKNGVYSACTAMKVDSACDYSTCNGPPLVFPNGGNNPLADGAFFQTQGLCGAQLLDFYIKGSGGTTGNEYTGLGYVHNCNASVVATCNAAKDVQSACGPPRGPWETVTVELTCSSDVCS
jgi:hypothetical protein